ncbi:CopL family metal-binding regulatory protein [Xanthomonadaceae bacterium JHOS43]|nr:CopL family metal-binding regulatory protein [Xanthomonadaceae bacterium JHOS43]MCX7564198.1 CopL family metal-binding regulatory protein [Xanthomonadaceae bacterium XH05]
MRPLRTLLTLLLLAAVAFDLGGGAWAMRAMTDQTQVAVDPSTQAPEAMPCHGDAGNEPAITTQHDHGDAGCALGDCDCDCGCAVTSAALPMPGVLLALAAPEARHMASTGGRVPDDFPCPGLRPPISA